MAKSYPLEWPKEKPRTDVGQRRHSTFGQGPKSRSMGWTRLLADLDLEVQKLGGVNLVLSSNQKRRLDGMPYAETSTVLDPGVAVYFDLEDMPVRFGCDQWLSVRENIRAIVLHLEAMRGQERWGVGTKKQAFSGYAGLMLTAVEEWRLLLGFTQHAQVTREDISEHYRERVKDVHPDHGGSPEAAQRLNEARDRALKEVR